MGRMAHVESSSPRIPRVLKWLAWSGVVAAIAWLEPGCASKDVNPPAARSRTGYVDFYTEADYELCWQVERVKPSGDTARVFEQFEPQEGRILRLAFAPGRYRFKVTFLNCVITRPATVEVEVKDGQIVPVPVTLAEVGKSFFDSRDVRVRGTAYGTYGRGTKIRINETTIYQISAEAQSPLPYQPKERAIYAAAAGK